MEWVEHIHEQAHPRACGENSTTRQAIRSAWGSSPRVRGKPHVSTVVEK
ncbi:hypothetical protein HMPREF9005_1178 [Actinomyces sp. oral taxon 178 str. F0338]|nr:hypothetical protein HMPREF9005_1178 [Actinomyces sp. oral taxon 178 str. F0338]